MCENKYCLQNCKQYCNQLKKSIAVAVISIPIECVGIVVDFCTSLNKYRRKDDKQLVGKEFHDIARYMCSNV